MDNIEFINIESINLIIPDLISDISNDMISLEYDRARFTHNKQTLRDAYISYTEGLQDVLDEFANKISSVFSDFKEDWGVRFSVPKNADKFRDLISDDVELNIDDTGSVGIEDKGSGLQRLAIILLQFEVIARLNRQKSPIIFIDEPDLYLHESLQRKLLNFLQDKSSSLQILYTTHSKIFIDTYKMKNIILLDAEISSQYVKRRNKNVNVVRTEVVDISSDDGYKMVCDHLGIEQETYELLEKINLLVEGECDKKYFSELINYFGLSNINIIPARGVNNIEKYLSFYNSYYNNYSSYKPKIKVVLDNDLAGRNAYKLISNKNKKNTYNNLIVTVHLLPNFLGNVADPNNLDHCKTNNEVEDFLYPEVFVYLVNQLLSKKGMIPIDIKKTCDQIKQISFKNAGILSLCEHNKNAKNPESGNEISFIYSDSSSSSVKEGLASIFTIEGNREIIRILDLNNENYPEVKKFLEQLVIINEDLDN